MALGGEFEIQADGSILVRAKPNVGNGDCWRDEDIAAAMPILLQLPTLTALDLDATEITDVGMAHVAKLRGLKTLSCQHYATGPLTDRSLSLLASLTQLQELALGAHYRIHGTTVGQLPKSLRVLKLCDTSVDDVAVAQCVVLQQLAHLDLGGTDITDAGMEHIAKLANLQVLEIGDTKVTNEGILQLRRSRTLQELDVIGALVYSDGAARLRQYLPHLAIRGIKDNEFNREYFKKK